MVKRSDAPRPERIWGGASFHRKSAKADRGGQQRLEFYRPRGARQQLEKVLPALLGYVISCVTETIKQYRREDLGGILSDTVTGHLAGELFEFGLEEIIRSEMGYFA
jgi:hypothetical protein